MKASATVSVSTARPTATAAVDCHAPARNVVAFSVPLGANVPVSA